MTTYYDKIKNICQCKEGICNKKNEKICKECIENKHPHTIYKHMCGTINNLKCLLHETNIENIQTYKNQIKIVNNTLIELQQLERRKIIKVCYSNNVLKNELIKLIKTYNNLEYIIRGKFLYIQNKNNNPKNG